MMSQHGALNSLFGDDPFFSPERMLWPMRSEALSSMQQDFFNQRASLADSLLRELHNGPQLLKLRKLPLISSSLTRRLSDATEQQQQQRESSAAELHRGGEPAQQQAVTQYNNNSDSTGDLLVTLDARGFAPSDITVKLEGRSLAVVAMKQAGAEENQSSSSPTSSASFSSSASSKVGFAQKIHLPAHLDLSGLSCSLMDGGQLRIHAPAVATMQPVAAAAAAAAVSYNECQDQEQPQRFRTSLEFPVTKE